jgi:hypothetical protein
MPGPDEEDRTVNNLIAVWDRIVCGYADKSGKAQPKENLSSAENDLLYLKPETPRGAQAKLLVMNERAMRDEASDVYDGGRKEFREERNRLVALLIEAGAALPLLAHYLPDL